MTKTVLSPLDKLNKTEKRLYAKLVAENPTMTVRPHAITLWLAHDCRFTPDFYLEGGLKPVFWEAKGPHAWEDSIIKIKTAVQLFTAFSFYFAQWKNNSWHITKFS